MIKRHSTESKNLKLITTMCFSILYYVSQEWLLATLKESLDRKLDLLSGQCLKILKSDMVYVNLHKNFLRVALYQTAISYFEVMNGQVYIHERNDLLNNRTSDCRNVYFTFVRSSSYKIGLNLLSNRLRASTNTILKCSMSYSREMFKTFCEINIVQRGLLLI